MDRPSTSKPRGTCIYYKTPRGCFAGKTCKFLHGDPEVDQGNDARLTPYDQSKTCRYFAKGFCKRADKCWFIHSLPSPSQAAGSRETQEDDSDPIDELCSICYEEPKLYGLLAGCNHVFCITCIRQWRDPAQKSSDVVDSGVHKQCPMCRAPSSFITPSSLFFKNEDPRKAETISQYKQSMGRVSCKYFIQSRAKDKTKPFCPFGKDCFYQHLNDDGTAYVFRDGVDASMRRFRQQTRSSVFNHFNFFADIFETVRREEAGRGYEWIDRLLEDHHLGQLQDTLQAVRNSLQQVDRIIEAGGSRQTREENEPAQRRIDLDISDSVLPALEQWNLGGRLSEGSSTGGPTSADVHPRTYPNEHRHNSHAPNPSTREEASAGDSDDSLPPLQDVDDTEESDDAWSTTDEEEDDLAPSQVDFRLFEGLNFLTIDDDDDDPSSTLEPAFDDEGDDDLPMLEPVSDDEGDEPPPLENVSDDEDNNPCPELGERSRPPFVTDGRGRVIGASNGRNSESGRQGATDSGTASSTEGVPRTFFDRFMDNFF
ncbi:hypothetical protein PM082_010771 [Marasmius tenuissimus]|nr:hypothetical protein PM082_010771 [Marasmius tenuissimus]